jgi:hypothetical protein
MIRAPINFLYQLLGFLIGWILFEEEFSTILLAFSAFVFLQFVQSVRLGEPYWVVFKFL